jgi:hypothetical protein
MIFAILLSVVGCAIAAGGIWLLVRIMNRRERWAIRLALVLAAVLVIGYPLSIGPLEYLVANHFIDFEAVEFLRPAYYPLLWLYENGPQPIRDLIRWYVDLWS